MPDCAFCAIVSGDGPAHRVYEDEHVLAFLDIRPFGPGHTLIIPKRHSAGLADLEPDEVARVFQVARRVALALRRSDLRADGVHLVLNDGRAAAQTVFHAHVHAIPRQRGDKLQMAGRMLMRRGGDLDSSADQLRAALAALDA
jgi:diadenosine tetraphosphate (Ap4A) HIT family hydrolase